MGGGAWGKGRGGGFCAHAALKSSLGTPHEHVSQVSTTKLVTSAVNMVFTVAVSCPETELVSSSDNSSAMTTINVLNA